MPDIAMPVPAAREFKPIAPEQALRALHQVVAEVGDDHVYVKTSRPAPEAHGGATAACMYWHMTGDKPGCLIGRALHRLGFSREDLILCDEQPELDEHGRVQSGAPTGTSVKDVHMRFPDRFTGVLVWRMLQAAQTVQDNGRTWGHALQAAISYREGWYDAMNEAQNLMRKQTRA